MRSLIGIIQLSKTISQILRDSEKCFHQPTRLEDSRLFNIGGNKIRLIAAIHYNRKKVYIRAVLTHKEYDSEKWKE